MHINEEFQRFLLLCYAWYLLVYVISNLHISPVFLKYLLYFLRPRHTCIGFHNRNSVLHHSHRNPSYPAASYFSFPLLLSPWSLSHLPVQEIPYRFLLQHRHYHKSRTPEKKIPFPSHYSPLPLPLLFFRQIYLHPDIAHH